MKRLMLTGVITVLFTLAAGSAIAALPDGGTFVDDDGNQHEPSIEAIAAVGVTKGCNPPANDRYCPGQSVTRAQMASFFVRAYGIPPSNVDRFSDDDGNVHEASINAIAAAGVTLGCNPPANTSYCPDQTVSRAQMASFMARVLKLPVPGTNYFGDDSGSVHEGNINAIAARGIAVPCGPGNYCPNSPVLRDVMATMLARSLQLTPVPPPPNPSPPPAVPPLAITRVKDVAATPERLVLLIGEATRITDSDGDEFMFSDGTGTIEIDLKDNLRITAADLNTCMIVGGPGGSGSEIEVRVDSEPPGVLALIGGRCPNGIDDF